MRPLFAPSPADVLSQGFFLLLGLISMVVIGNGFVTTLLVS